MDTKAHYTIVGFIVVLLLAGLIGAIIWMSIGLNRPTYNTFLIYMNVSVVGLNNEAPVKFNGVEVGYVKKMELNPKNPQEVIVDLQIKAGTPITTSTVATLAPQGITGMAYIGLSAKTPNAPLIKVSEEPPFPVIPTEPSLFVQLSSLFKDTSADISQMSNSVQNVLDAQNAANFKQILINLNTITQNIANNTASINETLKNTTVILKNTAAASQQFPMMTQSMKESVENLNEATDLVKQAMIPAVQLLNHLNTISGNVELFSNDIKQNPAVLLRGKANNNLGPGEK